MSNVDHHIESVARELMDKGYGYLRSNEIGRAKKVAKKLLNMHFSGGYEIMAHAYEYEGNRQKALQTLKEGVRNVPQVWVLWLQLGNLQSDLGMHENAMKSYERALKCPGAQSDSIAYNQAISLHRQERHDEALAKLDTLLDEELALPKAGLTCTILNAAGRHAEVIETGGNWLANRAAIAPSDKHSFEIATLHVEVAIAFMKGKSDNQSAMSHIHNALWFDKTHTAALRMMRELNNQESAAARHYWIIARGTWSSPLEESEELPSFYSTYEVVADSPDDALEYIRQLEPDDVRDCMAVEEWKELEACPDMLKGVYTRTGYCFFPKESDDA